MVSFQYLLITVLIGSLIGHSMATTRTYFIAADEITWDYASMGTMGMSGGNTTSHMSMRMVNMDITASLYITSSATTVGSQYKKAIYREYTDASFNTLLLREDKWLHLGLLGPVIRAEVGDTIQVTFRNHASLPYSIHPHGVFYSPENEGVPRADTMGMDGNMVSPGMTYTYEWMVPQRAGPASADPSSLVWMYHSHVDEVADTNAGLVGPIIITRAGAARSETDLVPTDVSREFVLAYTIVDENSSPYLDQSVELFMPAGVNMDELMMDDKFNAGNLKHAINGYIYANIQGLEMTVGEHVRWYVFGLGSETDVHGAHWHGQTLVESNHRVDATEIIPASMKTLDMIPDNPGRWMLHCHTNHHIMAGMVGFFDVLPCENSQCSGVSSLNLPHWFSILLIMMIGFFVRRE